MGYLLPIFLVVVALTLLFFLWVRVRSDKAKESVAMAEVNENDVTQRRQFTRVPLTVSAELRVPDGRRVRGETSDLSLMGAFVLADAMLAPLTECDMYLLVEGRQPSPVRLRLRGKVVRAAENGFAVQFTAMTRECYDNIKIILQYRADQDQIEKEGQRHPLRDELANKLPPEFAPQVDPPPQYK